ncbi:MAG TPA: hypothetical protein VGD71_29040, partial [Kribbella sp.]
RRRGVKASSEHRVKSADLGSYRVGSLGRIDFTVLLVETPALTLIPSLSACGRTLCAHHLLLLGQVDPLLPLSLAPLIPLDLSPSGQKP